MTQPARVLAFPHIPPRKPRRDSKPRQHLFEREIELMISACHGRFALRNQLLVLLMFRHGLRTREAIDLRWSDISSEGLYVRRVKGSTHAMHPLSARETLWLAGLCDDSASPLVFHTSRGPLSPRLVREIVADLGRRARLDLPVSPHMLRHSCGAWLSQQGADLRVIQAYLGHKSVQHTTHYVALAPQRFAEHYWSD